MNAMPSLFDAPPAQRHSETSVAAAESIKVSAGSMRARVLEAIAEEPGTDEEIAQRLGMNPSTERPRRIELVEAHLIRSTRQKKTTSGRWAQVWEAV